MKNSVSTKWINETLTVKNKLTVVLLTLLGVATSLLSTYSALITRSLINTACGAEGNLVADIIAYGVYLVLLLILEVGSAFFSAKFVASLENGYRARVMKCVMEKDYKSVTKYHSGDVLNRATSDVSVLTQGVAHVIPQFATVVSKIISAFVIMFVIDKELALIVLIAAPVTLIAARFYGNKVKSLHLKAQRSESENRSFMTEAVQNMTVIKAFRNERPVYRYFDGLQRKNYELKMKANYLSILANVLMFISMAVIYYFAMIWGANKIAAGGTLAFGTLTATLQLVSQFQSPLRSLSGIVNQYYKTVASAERLKELENLPDEKFDSKAENDDDFESIKIDNLSFAYDDVPVIANLTCEVKRGEVVTVAGPSGAGKSTLLKLIMGLLNPDEGSVTLVGAKDENNKSVFSYVPQGNMILSGTIKENVCFFNDNIPEEKITKALELCCIKDVVDALPNGINTKIGEKGAGLSEGQVQRLSLARALVMEKKILLLDEATSALDEATESKVVQNLKDSEYTIIMITHNRKLIESAARVIRV